MNNTKLPVIAPNFKYGSNSFYTLAYLHVYDKAMTIDDIAKVGERLSDRSKVRRSLEVLEKNGSVTLVTPTHWRITTLGIEQLLYVNSTGKK